MDSTDQQIINILKDDGKISLRDLAQQVKVSFVTVMNRIKRLEKEGIIRGYSAIIDYEKAGYTTFAMIQVTISKGKLFELEKRIASAECVSQVYDITGGFDAVVLARFKSTREMDKFLKHIQTFDFVEKTNTSLILNTIKDRQPSI